MDEIKNILLIEDNPDDIEFIKRAIEQDGHETQLITIMNGQDAMDLLNNQGRYENNHTPNFDLVVLDINLPQVNGLELLKQMRQDSNISKTTPIIIFTSSKDPNDIRTAGEYGANSYIQKPISYIKFEQVMHVIIKYWFDIDNYAIVK